MSPSKLSVVAIAAASLAAVGFTLSGSAQDRPSLALGAQGKPTLTLLANEGILVDPSSFAIFDTFPDDSGRETHLAGGVARALQERGPDLFARVPVIERIDLLAFKLP